MSEWQLQMCEIQDKGNKINKCHHLSSVQQLNCDWLGSSQVPRLGTHLSLPTLQLRLRQSPRCYLCVFWSAFSEREALREEGDVGAVSVMEGVRIGV